MTNTRGLGLSESCHQLLSHIGCGVKKKCSKSEGDEGGLVKINRFTRVIITFPNVLQTFLIHFDNVFITVCSQNNRCFSYTSNVFAF